MPLLYVSKTIIELIFLNVDDRLIDDKIIYTSDGSVIKKFDVKGGATIGAWIKLDKKIAIITGRNYPCASVRTKDLKIETVHQGVKDKLACAKKILEELNLDFFQCAVVGDYFNDKSLFENVGLDSKSKGARRDLKVDVTFDRKGGKTAVAQMIEYIIKKNDMQEEWGKLWL